MSSPDRPDEDGSGDAIADLAEETAELEGVARALIAAREAGGPIPKEVVQRGITALLKLYATRFQMGDRFSPFVDGRAMPATAVMISTTAMLRSVNIEVFELGFWQAFAGLRSSDEERG
jgi:hypothetical protein